VNLPFWLTKLLIRTRVARWIPALRRQAAGAEHHWHHFSDRVLASPRHELLTFASFRDAHGPNAIDFTFSAPRFEVVPSLHSRQPTERRGTPPAWGMTELRQAISERIAADSGPAVRADDGVLITHGASGAFSNIADAFVNPGNRVVVLDPCSPLFPLMLQQRRARIVHVPAWTENGLIRFQFPELARALCGAKLMVFANPCNPTGGSWSPEDLEQLAWWANRHDVLLCQDDTFASYLDDTNGRRLHAFQHATSRTLMLGSVSASHALASARVGWLTGPAPLVGACALTQHLTMPFVPLVSQLLAIAALRLNHATMAGIRAEFASTRRYAIERLTAMRLHPASASGGYFLWVPVHEFGVSGREFAEQLLRAKKVLVTPGEVFGPGGVPFIRLSLAGDEGRLREGLNRLATFVEETRPKAPVAPPPLPVARLAPEEQTVHAA